MIQRESDTHDLKYLTKLHEEKKKNGPKSRFLVDTKKFDKEVYDNLYTFEMQHELEDFTDPLIKTSKELESKNFLLNVKQRQLDAKRNERSDLNFKTEIESEDVHSFDNLIHNACKSKKNLRPNKIQNAKYEDKYVRDHLSLLVTGEDAISFFAKYGNTTPIKFIHCVQEVGKGPYKLRIVHDQNQLTKVSDYYTVSPNGIVHIFSNSLINKKLNNKEEKPTEFISLSDWMRESNQYNILVNVPFFKNYVTAKVFRSWVENKQKRKFESIRQMVLRDVFYCKPAFTDSIMSFKSIISGVHDHKMVNFSSWTQKQVDFEEFKAVQKDVRQKVSKDMDSILEEALHIVADLVDRVKEAKLKNSTANSEHNFVNSLVKQKPLNLIRREKEEKMLRQKLSEADYDLLGRFVRFVNYIAVENLCGSSISTLALLEEELQKERKSGLFTTSPILSENGVAFVHKLEDMLHSINYIVDENVKVLKEVPKILGNLAFDQFIRRLKGEIERIEYEMITPDISKIIYSSDEYKTLIDKINLKIENDFNECKKKVDTNYGVCKRIEHERNCFDVEVWISTKPGLEDVKNRLILLRDYKKDTAERIKDYFYGILHVDSKSVRNLLNNFINNCMNRVKDYLYSFTMAVVDQTLKNFTAYNSSLSIEVNELKDYSDIIKSYQGVNEKLPGINFSKDEIDHMFKLLKQVNYVFVMEDKSKYENIMKLHESIETNLKFVEADIKTSKDKFAAKFEELVNLCATKATEVKELVGADDLMQSSTPINEALHKVDVIKDKLEKLKGRYNKITEYQKTMKFPEPEKLDAIENIIVKYDEKKALWSNMDRLTKNRESWFEMNVRKLDTEHIEKELHELNLYVAQQQSKSESEVLSTLQGGLKELNEKLPAMMAVGNKHLLDSHWNDMLKLFDGGQLLSAKGGFTLTELLKIGIESKLSVVEDISAKATGEAAIQNDFGVIVKDWSEVVLKVMPYRSAKNKFVLTEVSEIFEKLEDSLLKIQGMIGSKFVSLIRHKVESWEKRLLLVQSTLEEWLYLQKQWMYLENVFSADDIQKQLPSEYSKFHGIDKHWRDIMFKAFKKPGVLENITGEEMLKQFTESNKQLENIQKLLEDYLDLKRRAFPRFYFLSNDELLEIFSQTRNPQAVQPHLRKCFDNIKAVEFNKDDETSIIAMIGADPENDREVVKFDSPVTARGPVESWLNAIEDSMRTTLYNRMKELAEKTLSSKMLMGNADLFDFPAQIVLAINMIAWTKYCEKAISNTEIFDVKMATEGKIEKLVNLINTDLTVGQRELVKSLIVLDVHNRDVVTQLASLPQLEINDFKWKKEFRYYWKQDQGTEFDCYINQTSFNFRYGYEYLGNSPRLVITPLTDKCYLTLTSALQLNYGGAPSGPAGTGKTETVKDLSKAVANICIVFNCSDSIVYETMARFLSGLAQCGAWACFDEFNRIEIEVLSVIAQQILVIQTAVRQKKEEFDFEGRFISLKPNFGVFITMNPGYAGRTELPDNLKALFRPVAMMIPDYGLIAEIILFSEGFKKANALARKMVSLYKLSSEQLSKQKHYDFGMRAVKSVLTMAGVLYRKNRHMDEETLLLKAMRDSNLPKFLKRDIPLFEGIINDLFPKLEVKDKPSEELLESIDKTLQANNLQPDKVFINKTVQLYETSGIRHGVMIVGAAGCGKSTIVKVLVESMRLMLDKIHLYKLNPKSITIGDLFGWNDVFTNTFNHGIVSKLVTNALEEDNEEKKWFMFDGPVDADWIENLNTVLDDNKMLCLPDGKRLKLPYFFSMLFEVENLNVASPATVSRCGMIYMDHGGMNEFVIFNSWKNSLFIKLSEMECNNDVDKALIALLTKDSIYDKFRSLLEDMFEFITQNKKEVIESVNINLLTSTVNLLEIMIFQYIAAIFKKSAASKQNDALRKSITENDVYEYMYLHLSFASAWGLAGNLSAAVKQKFSEMFKPIISKLTGTLLMNFKSLYEFYIDFESLECKSWSNKVKEYVYNPKTPFFSIMVDTPETVSIKYVLKALTSSNASVFLNGVTGTGKSMLVANYLSNLDENYSFKDVFFSAQTSSKNLEDTFFDKYTQKGKDLCPTSGKRMILFIDDINMPKLDKYGAQPVNELLRQIIDHEGFYDLKKYQFRHVRDTCFVAACAPPDGGRNPLPARLVRHFHLLHLAELDTASMTTVFGSILKGFLGLDSNTVLLSDLGLKIVAASIQLYQNLRKELLPTPLKCHYTFNLRDISKVFQGIMRSKYDKISNSEDLIDLWIYEACRVFKDRLVNNEDRVWFDDRIIQLSSKTLKRAIDSSDISRNIYTDILTDDYKRVESLDELNDKLNKEIAVYNSAHSSALNLILFESAVKHICNIKRIISFTMGNAILVGLSGSGKKSLARVAAHLNHSALFSFDISKNYKQTQWKDDLKRMLMSLIEETLEIRNGTVFLLSDDQMINDNFLEDANNLLNTGKIYNLFAAEEMEEVYRLTRIKARSNKVELKTNTEINDYFNKLVRDNLHIILTFSPIGSTFRDKCRQFPSLINYSTIDWFDKWPQEAYVKIAQSQLSKQDNLTSSDLESLSKVMLDINTSVENLAEEFFATTKRKVYITPSSFLEFLNLYNKLVAEYQVKIPQQAEKYRLGLSKMAETKEKITVLKEEIIAYQPLLEKAKEDNEVLKKDLEEKSAVAMSKESVCEAEAGEIAQTRASVAELKRDCQNDLNEALPALYQAQTAAKSVDKNYISTIKTYNTVAKDIETVLCAINLIFGKKETWEEVRKFLGDMEFHKKLTTLDPMTVPNKIWTRLRKEYLDKPEFDPQYLREKVSEAVSTFASYCINMEIYYKKKREVDPKEKKLKGAEEELERVEEILKVKTDELALVKGEVHKLQENLQESIKNAQTIEDNQTRAKLQLVRAEKLITGLEDETTRWVALSAILAENQKNMVGDLLLAASYISYIGPFSVDFRQKLHTEWSTHITTAKIPLSKDYELVKVLSDDLTVREWQMNGLPSDTLSTENALLVTRTYKWPLMIDPQMQANYWIKRMYKEQGLVTIKANATNMLKILENAVRFGNSVLLENVEETLDGSLDAILLRKFKKKGPQVFVKITDVDIPYNNDFKLFMTSKLPNPHFLPEVTLKTNIINFTVTEKGLEDQLLGKVVKIEKPELEEEKGQLIKQISDDNKQLHEIQEKILKLIVEVQGNILDDEELIQTLESSKQTTIKINERMEKAKVTNINIDNSRDNYRPIAERGSILYHIIAGLVNIDPMYQHSLEHFVHFFIKGIQEYKEYKNDVTTRVEELKSRLTILIFYEICQGMFEKHKLMYAFLIAIKIALQEKSVVPRQWEYFKFGNSKSMEHEAACPEWFADKEKWQNVVGLQAISHKFSEITKVVIESKSYIIGLLEKDNISYTDLDTLPGLVDLEPFEKLLLLKALRPEKLETLINNYIVATIGQVFVDWPGFDLKKVYANSTFKTPIILILAPGADPLSNLKALARSQDIDDMRFRFVSLGQGQGEKAKEIIKVAQLNGDWICLQNCHLVSSWLPELELVQENIGEDCNQDYRLFLTTVPTDKFPVTFLHSAIKITNEPPKGIRANLKRIYKEIDEDWYKETTKPNEFRNLLFCLSAFHSVMLERRKFGSTGWNISYEWMTSDLETSQKHLKSFIESSSDVPFDSLELMISDINYGGRVTDYNDQNLVKSLLKLFINTKSLKTGNVLISLNNNKNLEIPKTESIDMVLEYIDSLPIDDQPNVFGLHPNASIKLDLQRSEEVKQFISLSEPNSRSIGGSRKPDEFVLDLIAKFKERLPKQIAIRDIDYNKSLLVFRNQEAERFNSLLKSIAESLDDLEMCVKGLKVMSMEKEEMYKSFLSQEVPSNWQSKSFLSLKKLYAWFDDLIERIKFFYDWMKKESMDSYWMSSFYFPQGFLTAILQTYARKHVLPIDSLTIKTVISDESTKLPDNSDAFRIRGFYLENGSYNHAQKQIDEALPRTLHFNMPLIEILPVEIKDYEYNYEIFKCPVYKTTQRRGELSTTGHSTNFVMNVDLPIQKASRDKWIGRSTAIVLQPDN